MLPPLQERSAVSQPLVAWQAPRCLLVFLQKVEFEGDESDRLA